MTLIPCVSEKLFRPWDNDTNTSKTDVSSLKEEPRMVVSPAASSSSSDESEMSSVSSGGLMMMPSFQQAYSAHLMAQQHYQQQQHHYAWIQQQQRPLLMPTAEAPSMERFLASLEAAPEVLHPSRLAALGMGPNDIGELYQLAGFKPLAASALIPSVHHHQTSSSSGSKKQRPKRFRCPHCQVAFSNNGQLKGHVRSHTGNFFEHFKKKF